MQYCYIQREGSEEDQIIKTKYCSFLRERERESRSGEDHRRTKACLVKNVRS